jgi:multicomponent Na+:H+ antiporter subunit B
MTPSGRRMLFLVGAAGFLALLVWGFGGLPDFGNYRGPYGDILNRVAVDERHVSNIVAAVVFDYRGFDTLIEECILFAAVVGVALLLRAGRGEEEHSPEDSAEDRKAPDTSAPVRVVGLGIIGPAVLVGVYVVAHGHISPGGGFQGGVVLAAASLFVYLAGEYVSFRRVNPTSLIDFAEGAGIAGYVGIGLAGLGAGAAFLDDWLPLGTAGNLLSGGTIPLLNLSIGLAVSAGVVLLLYELLEQALVIRRRR